MVLDDDGFLPDADASAYDELPAYIDDFPNVKKAFLRHNQLVIFMDSVLSFARESTHIPIHMKPR
jgi:hypothetical protein